MVAIIGPYLGYQAPGKITNKYYYPQHLLPTAASTMTTTANDMWFMPMLIEKPTTFTAAKTFSSANTNGHTARFMAFADSGTGPGTLLQDFGQITYNGSSGVFGAITTVTFTGPQIIWIAHWSANTGDTVNTMSASGSATVAGYYPWNPLQAYIGRVNLTQSSNSFPVTALYASLAYGSAPASAPAVTSDNLNQNLVQVPLLGLLSA